MNIALILAIIAGTWTGPPHAAPPPSFWLACPRIDTYAGPSYQVHFTHGGWSCRFSFTPTTGKLR